MAAPPGSNSLAEQSPLIRVALTIARSTLAAGEQVLIFSGRVALLDGMGQELAGRVGISFLRLDGKTPVKTRQALINQFSQPGLAVRLSPLDRAGGRWASICRRLVE